MNVDERENISPEERKRAQRRERASIGSKRWRLVIRNGEGMSKACVRVISSSAEKLE